MDFGILKGIQRLRGEAPAPATAPQPVPEPQQPQQQPAMDPATELANLKFTPRSSAWKHMQRFENLVARAYPRATDAGKWSLFVKTIDTNNNTWGNRPGQLTPSRWLMELNEEWIRDNPPCDDPNCDDCKNDAMSFEYLKTAFLERWGRPDRERDKETSRPPHPSRGYSHHPSSDSGSEDGDLPPMPAGALVPHAPHLNQFPPAAPTPPNEPVSDRERVVQETKTSIAINAEQGAGQIVLSITNNRHRNKRKSKPIAGAIEAPPSREASPSPQQMQHTPPPQHPGPPQHPVQVIEADPERDAFLDMVQRNKDRDAREREMQRERDLSATPPPTRHGFRGGGSPPPHHRSHSPGPHGLHRSHTRPPTPPRDDRSLDRSIDYLSEPATPSTPPPPPLRPRLLEGKVCAITGASRGIGRAIALGFAKEGAHITAHYWGTKSDPANEEIVSLCVAIRGMGQGCTIVFGDISDPRTSENIIRRAVETYGRLDIAVGNAGMCWFRDLFDVTPELLRRHVDVNLNGNFYFVQAAARQFKRQFHEQQSMALRDRDADAEGGVVAPPPQPNQDYSILCISSSTTGQGMAHFSPTAAGVRELMKTCAVSLGKYGVRCNTLSPGIVQTKMVHEELMDMEKRGALEKRVPLGRLGVPGDVVGPAVWLAGEMGRFVTGAEIRIDGGVSVNV